MFFTPFGYWAGGGVSRKGWVHNLLVLTLDNLHFCTLGSSKIEVFETCFFDIVFT